MSSQLLLESSIPPPQVPGTRGLLGNAGPAHQEKKPLESFSSSRLQHPLTKVCVPSIQRGNPLARGNAVFPGPRRAGR